MDEILHWVQAAVDSGWPFVFTMIVIGLALYVRQQIEARIADLKDRITHLEANCLGDDNAVG
jgi:hypothetical protein